MPDDDAPDPNVLYDSIGRPVGATCTECGRLIDGTRPKKCADCAKGRDPNAVPIVNVDATVADDDEKDK